MVKYMRMEEGSRIAKKTATTSLQHFRQADEQSVKNYQKYRDVKRKAALALRRSGSIKNLQIEMSVPLTGNWDSATDVANDIAKVVSDEVKKARGYKDADVEVTVEITAPEFVDNEEPMEDIRGGNNSGENFEDGLADKYSNIDVLVGDMDELIENGVDIAQLIKDIYGSDYNKEHFYLDKIAAQLDRLRHKSGNLPEYVDAHEAMLERKGELELYIQRKPALDFYRIAEQMDDQLIEQLFGEDTGTGVYSQDHTFGWGPFSYGYTYIANLNMEEVWVYDSMGVGKSISLLPWFVPTIGQSVGMVDGVEDGYESYEKLFLSYDISAIITASGAVGFPIAEDPVIQISGGCKSDFGASGSVSYYGAIESFDVDLYDERGD